MTVEQVIAKMQGPDPVSLIRCGDGEKIVLDGFDNYVNYNAILKRQLGFSPSIDEAQQIRNNLITAISQCDILGVPRHKNLEKMGNHWRKVEETIDNMCKNVTKVRCSLDIHYDILEYDEYHRMLNRRPLAYIGCRDLVAGFMKRYMTSRVDWYEIAPEAKFTSYDGLPHYPDQFNKVEKWMGQIKPNGRILLVGAGVIGKIYCNWWRDRGGQAMDVGSVMDEWAGRVTRGPDRFLDKIEHNKYTIIDTNLQQKRPE